MKVRFSKRTLLKVVVFTAISAVFTVGLGVKIGNLRLFSHDYTLQAVFSDASGVFKGDAVKLAGVDVGRVSGTSIEDGKAVVTFRIDDSIKLTKDSVVAIRWRNVLGQRFLYVFPGSQTGAPLADGDTIPLAQTENAGDLNEFLNRLGPILKAIDPQKANSFLDAINTALGGNEASVRQLLDDGAVLASRLGGMDQQIETLIGSSDTVMSTYAQQNQSIDEIITDLDQLGAKLKSMTGDINAFVTNFADVQSQLDAVLKASRGNIDATISELGSVAATLQKDKGNLETTLCTLPAGLAPYFQTTSWGEWFNVRVVQVIIKDRQSDTVGTVGETDQEHPPSVPPAYSQCAQAPKGNSSGSGKGLGAAPSSKTPNGKPAPQPTDLEDFIRFVIGGGDA